jgi:hypothetical protein
MFTPDHERYQIAEQLYCFTDKSIPEIAEITGIPKPTLYQRARTYNWQSLRRASRRSPAILAEEMYKEVSDLTASVNKRPVGERISTPQEADLRKKILSSIAAIKKFPTHAEVAFIMQSLLRYVKITTPHHELVSKILESFMSHRDFYGYASFQPEYEQDLNMADEMEMDLMFNSPESSPFNQEAPEDMQHIVSRNRSGKPIDFDARSKGAPGNGFDD